jgi:hypothetical protein
MKRTILLLISLSVMACNKTSEVTSKKLQSTSPDPDIASMQTLIRQVTPSLLKAKDLHELNDGVTESELSTLAPKMGLTIEQAKEWFEQFNITAAKLYVKFPDGKIKKEDVVSNLLSPYTDCQATAEGVFCGAVAACATASAASGIFAPAVMSVCGGGAIIMYCVQMNACDTKYGCPCVN